MQNKRSPAATFQRGKRLKRSFQGSVWERWPPTESKAPRRRGSAIQRWTLVK
jgi:hypothetical protein